MVFVDSGARGLIICTHFEMCNDLAHKPTKSQQPVNNYARLEFSAEFLRTRDGNRNEFSSTRLFTLWLAGARVVTRSWPRSDSYPSEPTNATDVKRKCCSWRGCHSHRVAARKMQFTRLTRKATTQTKYTPCARELWDRSETFIITFWTSSCTDKWVAHEIPLGGSHSAHINRLMENWERESFVLSKLNQTRAECQVGSSAPSKDDARLDAEVTCLCFVHCLLIRQTRRPSAVNRSCWSLQCHVKHIRCIRHWQWTSLSRQLNKYWLKYEAKL